MTIIDVVGKEYLQYVGYNVFGKFILLDVHTHTHKCTACNDFQCSNLRYKSADFIHYLPS